MAGFDFEGLLRSVMGPSESGGFEFYNTVILGLFALLFLWKIAWPVLKKHGVKVDQKLVIASTPFLLFGTVIRALEDSGFLPYSFNPLEIGFYTHTPGLWVFIAVLIIVSFVFFKKFFEEKKTDYRNAAGLFGSTLFVFSLFFLFQLEGF